MEVRCSLIAKHNDIKSVKKWSYMYIFSFDVECKATLQLLLSVWKCFFLYCSWALRRILKLSLLSLTVPEFQNDYFPEFTATANREDFTVRRKSAECLMEHCQSTARDFWVLTDIFRPTRKILFVYVRIANASLAVCTMLPILEDYIYYYK